DQDPDAAVCGQQFPPLQLTRIRLVSRESGCLLQFRQELQLLGGIENLQGASRTSLDALDAADALLQVDHRLTGLAHLDAVHRTDTLAAGAAGDALARQQPDLAAGLFDRFFHVSHSVSYKTFS